MYYLFIPYHGDESRLPKAYADLTAAKAEFLAGQDAAGYAENVNLYAAGHNLKAITRGSLKSAEVLTLLGLEKGHTVVLAQTVGK